MNKPCNFYFFKEKPSINRFRVITAPRSYFASLEGNKIVKTPPGPSRRWVMGVIDRETDSVKILDFPGPMYVQIQNLVFNQKFGYPYYYDLEVEIEKVNNDIAYRVTPMANETIASDQLLIKEFDQNVLNQLVDPKTPVPNFLNWYSVKSNESIPGINGGFINIQPGTGDGINRTLRFPNNTTTIKARQVNVEINWSLTYLPEKLFNKSNICNKCNQESPYAEPAENFVCWGCENGY